MPFFRILEFLCLKVRIFSFRKEGIFVYYRTHKPTQSIQTVLWTASVYFWYPMAVGHHLSLTIILSLGFSCFFCAVRHSFYFLPTFSNVMLSDMHSSLSFLYLDVNQELICTCDSRKKFYTDTYQYILDCKCYEEYFGAANALQ